MSKDWQRRKTPPASSQEDLSHSLFVIKSSSEKKSVKVTQWQIDLAKRCNQDGFTKIDDRPNLEESSSVRKKEDKAKLGQYQIQRNRYEEMLDLSKMIRADLMLPRSLRPRPKQFRSFAKNLVI